MSENNNFLNKKRAKTKESEEKSDATKKKKISAVENVENQLYNYTVDNNTWTGTYTGQWENGKPHGKGELRYQDDDYDNGRYTGQWENGKPDGTGKLYYKNGQPKYTGQWKNGKPHGKGICYYLDGIRYDGEFVDGKINGIGKLYRRDGTLQYEGDFVNGNFNGEGILYYNNGDYCKGKFVDGKCEGKGEIYYKDGKLQYDGEFKNNKCNGIGKSYYEDGKTIKYDGEFADGRYNGKGIYYRNNGDRYEGKFVNGEGNGKGILYYKNGDSYDGDFINGKFHGKGVLYHKDGDRYEGEFANNKFNGKGKLYYEDGKTLNYEGEFVNGRYNGEGILYRKNGDRYEGKFENGLLRNGVITFANGIEAKIENYECVDIDRTKQKGNLKHANGYMIDFRTDKKINQFRKIGKYGEYKDIIADEDFLKERKEKENIDVKKLIEEKIEQVCEDVEQKIKKGINQITLSLFIHGNDEQYLRVKKQYVLSLLEKLSKILEKHENVKIYIENLACHAATKFEQCKQYKHPEIKDLEKAISSYFGKSCDNRVFYTKSAVPNKPVRYHKTTDKHVADDENETKFDYYRLTGKQLVKYNGEHDNAKQQKNADLHGNKVIDKTVNNNLENKDKDKKNSII